MEGEEPPTVEEESVHEVEEEAPTVAFGHFDPVEEAVSSTTRTFSLLLFLCLARFFPQNMISSLLFNLNVVLAVLICALYCVLCSSITVCVHVL